MAMTKAEKAYVEKLEKDLRILSALRWTEPVERDVSAPDVNIEDSPRFTQGWDVYSNRVEEAWSTFVSHGSGQYEEKGYRSGSQRSRALYSTKLRALQALRYNTELNSAGELANIDQWIEEAKNETPL